MRSISWLNAGPRSIGTRNAKVGDGTEFKLRDLWQAAVLLGVFLFGLVVATLYPSGKDDQYMVVAPPWYSLSQTLALVESADGRLVDTGGPANMAIIHSTKPDFVRTLYGAGAWLVIDPVQLRGCIGFKPAGAETRT